MIRVLSRIGFDLHENITVERHYRYLKFRCPIAQETEWDMKDLKTKSKKKRFHQVIERQMKKK